MTAGRSVVRWRAVNKSPSTQLVYAMSALVPDVGNSNAYVYFIAGDSNPPTPTLTAFPSVSSSPQSTQKYNTLTDTWTSTKRVPSRHQYFGGATPVSNLAMYGGAATVGTIIYAIGAAGNNLAPFSPTTAAYWGTNEAYQAMDGDTPYRGVADSWTTRVPMPVDPLLSRATIVASQGNRIFTFATNPPGTGGPAKLKNVNKYDTATDRWTSCAHGPRRPW